MSEVNVSITIEYPFELQRIADLIDTGLMGAGYWLDLISKPDGCCDRATCDCEYKSCGEHLISGGKLRFNWGEEEDDSQTKDLSLEDFTEALKLMAANHPKHMIDFLIENEDADTGDIFLQLALLKEVVYG